MNILTYIFAFSIIIGGVSLVILGFKNTSTSFNWFGKITGPFLMILGISYVVFPDLSPFASMGEDVSKEWTEGQKEYLAQGMIKNSNKLKSINQDTAQIVSRCVINKYTSEYTIADSWKHDKLPKENMMDIFTPIITDCFNEYGVE